jgi:excisionase family DNA binding protein
VVRVSRGWTTAGRGSQSRAAQTQEDRTVTPSTAPPTVAALPALLDVRGVAALLGCSPRHIYRLADAGRMPAPVRIGALVRWPRAAVEAWIAGGCRPIRRGV